MKIRWGLVTLGLLVACAAPAQNPTQISVTVADGVVTVTPKDYRFAKDQTSPVTVALGTRGYTITAVTPADRTFSCQPASAGTWTCQSNTRTQRQTNYTVTVTNGGTPINSNGDNIFIQED